MSRILILEANDETRRCMHEALQINDHEVASTDSREVALKIVATFMPELVIADWQAADGAHLCENLRAFHHYDDVPIILTDHVLNQAALAAGNCMKDRDTTDIKAQLMSRYPCDDFWPKPDNLEALVDLVAWHLTVAQERGTKRREKRFE